MRAGTVIIIFLLADWGGLRIAIAVFVFIRRTLLVDWSSIIWGLAVIGGYSDNVWAVDRVDPGDSIGPVHDAAMEEVRQRSSRLMISHPT